MEVKTCSLCGEAKPMTEFRKSRARCKECTRRKQRATRVERKASPYQVDHEHNTLLPVGPFRTFLKDRLSHYGTIEEMAEAMGIADRTIRRILRESRFVQLDTVDRVLVREGSTPLAALYPEELYPSDEMVA